MRGQAPYKIARMAIKYVPEDRNIFADLTVRQKLEIVARPVEDGGWDVKRVYSVFPVLKNLDGRRGGTLSGGEQQMLSVGRALMGNPDLLLLDQFLRNPHHFRQ